MKTPPSLVPRFEGEWFVGEEKKIALMKAKVGRYPNQPPRTGWRFYNQNQNLYEEDESFTCTNNPGSLCHIVTVSLSGEAKGRMPQCEGRYESTGLISMGRQVSDHYILCLA